MKVLISGTSKGIGLALANHFLKNNHEVYGLDILPSSISNPNYHHYQVDISKKETLPDIRDINILINNAGVQNQNDIDVNLKGTINVTKKYAFQKEIKSVLFNASASARSGFEFAEYAASKGGVVAYMKNVAVELAKYQATVNSISLGGVLTDSNEPVINDKESWKKIMDVTPLKKWMSLDEVCDWVYFLTITNKSMSGQDILIDNGELNLNSTFVWPK